MSKKSESISTTNLLLVGILVFGAVIAYLLFSLGKSPSNNPGIGGSVTEVDGKQYIDITAKGGFFPNTITAKSNIDSVLRVNTQNTFDCSSALVIPSLNYRTNLPATGSTEIQIPSQAPGSELNGMCAMGMYRFKIKFT